MAGVPLINFTLDEIADIVESTYAITLADRKFSTIVNACDINHFDPNYGINYGKTLSNVVKFSHFKKFPFESWDEVRYIIRNHNISLNSFTVNDEIIYSCRMYKKSNDAEIAFSWGKYRPVNPLEYDSSGDTNFEEVSNYSSDATLIHVQDFVFLYESNKGKSFVTYPNVIIPTHGEYYIKLYVDIYYNSSSSTATEIIEIRTILIHTLFVSATVKYYSNTTTVNSYIPIIDIDFLNQAIVQNNI
jgi:hypothetical protein